jgi:hypothetical protein
MKINIQQIKSSYHERSMHSRKKDTCANEGLFGANRVTIHAMAFIVTYRTNRYAIWRLLPLQNCAYCTILTARDTTREQ